MFKVFQFNKLRANRLHTEALVLESDGKEDEAIAKYSKAIEFDSKKSSSFYNLGLIYQKHEQIAVPRHPQFDRPA